MRQPERSSGIVVKFRFYATVCVVCVCGGAFDLLLASSRLLTRAGHPGSSVGLALWAPVENCLPVSLGRVKFEAELVALTPNNTCAWRVMEVQVRGPMQRRI